MPTSSQRNRSPRTSRRIDVFCHQIVGCTYGKHCCVASGREGGTYVCMYVIHNVFVISLDDSNKEFLANDLIADAMRPTHTLSLADLSTFTFSEIVIVFTNTINYCTIPWGNCKEEVIGSRINTGSTWTWLGQHGLFRFMIETMYKDIVLYLPDVV